MEFERKFKDMLPELELKQLMQVCRLLGVETIDRSSIVINEEQPDPEVAIKNAKMRRDFDKIYEELGEAYNKLPRRARRQLDRITTKIVRANETIRSIKKQMCGEDYGD